MMQAFKALSLLRQVRLLRRMLEWQSDLLGPEAPGGGLSPAQQASMVRSATGGRSAALPGLKGGGAAALAGDDAERGAGRGAAAAAQLAPAQQEQQVDPHNPEKLSHPDQNPVTVKQNPNL